MSRRLLRDWNKATIMHTPLDDLESSAWVVAMCGLYQADVHKANIINKESKIFQELDSGNIYTTQAARSNLLDNTAVDEHPVYGLVAQWVTESRPQLLQETKEAPPITAGEYLSAYKAVLATGFAWLSKHRQALELEWPQFVSTYTLG